MRCPHGAARAADDCQGNGPAVAARPRPNTASIFGAIHCVQVRVYHLAEIVRYDGRQHV